MLKDFTPRLYQETIFSAASRKNTLVVLPTGMGKTAIALLMAAHRLTQYPDSKILVLAPTKPLADQLRGFLSAHLELEKGAIALFTGEVRPEKRKDLYLSARIIVSTPQTIENDLLSNALSLKGYSLVIFDEAHRTVGEYAYGYIAEQYHKQSRFPRVLALTASPGSEIEKVQELLAKLRIEEIEVRTEEDPDVKPYIQQVDLQWKEVPLPASFSEIKRYLSAFTRDKLTQISERGYIDRGLVSRFTKKDILGLQAKLRAEMLEAKDFEAMRCISLAAEVMKVEHAVELLETQGISALHTYLQKLEREGYTSKTKASQNIVKDINFRSALIKARALYESGERHPKLSVLREMVEAEVARKQDVKLIVFNQYRDNAHDIVTEINGIPGVSARLFVGQAKKNGSGLSQKEQLAMLDDFRSGAFNVLVSSSVGEEGLDIPAVDLVIFFEPVPSAIRHIQRRGRTARLEEGRVVILVTKGTRDEAYRWTSFHKEKRMYRNLAELKRTITMLKREQEEKETKHVTLDRYARPEHPLKVIVDHRETNSGVVKQLKNLGAEIALERLQVGDYVLSNRVGVEFKTVKDFIDSLLDNRLLTQANLLRQTFPRALIIVEGTESIYSVRNLHPHSVMGMLATINVSYGIPIIYTKDPFETARMLLFIAKREQDETGKDVSAIGMRKAQTLHEQQEQLVASVFGIGPTLARPLLERFGSISGIVNASVDELREVPLIGEKKARKIKEVFESRYEPESGP